MKFQRYLNHPVFKNPRSQFIFLLFFIVVGLLSGVLAGMEKMLLEELDVDRARLMSEGSFVVLLFISPVTHLVLAILGAISGCALTCTFVIGPFRRLEDWMEQYQAGDATDSFQVRKGDEVFQNIVNLIKQTVENRSRKKKS